MLPHQEIVENHIWHYEPPKCIVDGREAAATPQSSYDVLATGILYLFCITERILYLIDDISIILHVPDTRL